MKALTISFSSDKTDCKKLFLAWFRHSRSNVIRISLLALIGFALLFEIWSPFYLRTFNVPPQEYFSLLFFVMAACMFMLFCIPFVVVMPRIRYSTFLYTVDSLKKSGTSLKEVSFLEDALKLDLVLYGLSSQKVIPYRQIKKCTVLPSGIVFYFHKELPLLLIPKAVFHSEKDFFMVSTGLKSFHG